MKTELEKTNETLKGSDTWNQNTRIAIAIECMARNLAILCDLIKSKK